MSREDFKSLMEELLKLKEIEIEISNSMKKLDSDFCFFSLSRYEALVVKCLEKALDDKQEWISYFLYERNAKFTRKKVITDSNGKKIPFDNYDDIYDLIMDSHNFTEENDKKKNEKPKGKFKFPWQ